MTKFHQMGHAPTREKLYSFVLLSLFAATMFFVGFPGRALAAESDNYQIPSGSVFIGGSQATSADYDLAFLLGALPMDSGSSANYSTANLSPLLLSVQSVVTAEPTIANVKFDGREVKDGDYVNANALLTATVLSNVIGSAISLESSRVIVNGAATAFSDTTGNLIYNQTTGTLSLALQLSSTQTITIEAQDMLGDAASYSSTVKVGIGTSVQALQTAVYPNPFNPTYGKLKIGYQLSQDAPVTLYLFNELRQPVWRKAFVGGGSGGQIGYNEYEWSGITDFNEQIPGGAYLLYVVSDNKVIGKTKLAVVR